MSTVRVDRDRFERLFGRAIVPHVVLMALLAGVLGWQVSWLLEVTREVEVSDQNIALTHDLEKLLIDLETGQRGYLLAGDTEFLEPYEQSNATIDAHVRQLKERFSGHPAQEKHLDEIAGTLAEWRADAISVREKWERANQNRAVIDWARGKRLMDAMRNQVATLIHDETVLRDAQRKRPRAGNFTLVAAVASAIVAGGLLAMLARRQLIKVSDIYDGALHAASEEMAARQLHEERFRIAVGQVADHAIFLIDSQGRLQSWNEGVRQIFGYEKFEWLGKPFDMVFPPEDVPQAPQQEFAQARLAGTAASDAWQVKKDGTRFFSGGITTMLRDAKGESSGFIKVMRDRTQQKLGEDAVRASEARFRRLFEASFTGTAIVGYDGIISQANEAFLRLVGYSAEDVAAGKLRWTTLTPPEYLPLDSAAQDQVRATGICTPFEKEYIRKDGSRVPVLIGEALLYEDRDGAIVKWAVDLTEARRAEERFRLMADNAPVLIWLSGIDKGRYWFNKPWLTFTGRTPDQERGSGWIEAVHPDDVERVVRTYTSSFDARKPFSQEYRLRRHDGSYRWILVNGLPLYDPAGEFTGYIGSGVDITERKVAEDERDQLLASERAARSEAEHANRMKDEFLSGLSHELRTPLNAILGWADLLAMGKLNNDDMKQGIEVIQRNSRIQAQLIEDLLDMSRIIAGKVRLDIQRIDVGEVIKRALQGVLPAAAAKGISIEPVLGTVGRQVAGDPARLQQVVWNLLSNAIKFTPKGGRVQVLLERVNSHIEITVSDTGEGIKADFLPYVFDRFRQFDASTTRRHGGMGLGLAIVKQLVELHGGTVRAKSPGEGQGASFVVVLPLTPVHSEPTETDRFHPTAATSAPVDYEVTNLKGVRVLVVDDEPDARDLIGRILNECEATVSTAASADEALAVFERDPPHVLISDIGMPKRDGYDLIRAIRSQDPERGGNVPAIALTAFARSEDRRRAILAGYQMHVVKPVEPAELITVVASLAHGLRGRSKVGSDGEKD